MATQNSVDLRRAYNTKLTLLEDGDDVKDDPVHTELLLLESNLVPIMDILSHEFLKKQEFEKELEKRQGRNLKDFLRDVTEDASHVDGTNNPLPNARWRKSKKRKIRKKKHAQDVEGGGLDSDDSEYSGSGEWEEGEEDEEDEEEGEEFLREEITREELCGEFVKNVLQVVSQTVLQIRNTFAKTNKDANGAGDKDGMPEHVKKQLDDMRSQMMRKNKNLEQLTKNKQDQYDKMMQLKEDLQDAKATTHGLDFEQIDNLISRVDTLEKENQYLYARILGQEAAQGKKVTLSRMSNKGDQSQIIASLTSQLRLKTKYLAKLEKSAMFALDRDAGAKVKGGSTKKQVEEMLIKALGKDEAGKRLAAMGRGGMGAGGGAGFLEEDEDDVELYEFSALPEIDPKLPEEEKERLRKVVADMRESRREMRYMKIEETNAEIINRIVEPATDHFFNVTEMIDRLQDVVASLPENPKKRTLAVQMDSVKKKVNVEKDSLISTIRFTCGSAKETITKFALLMNRKRKLRNAEVDDEMDQQESESLGEKLREAAEKKKDRERQRKADNTRLNLIRSATPSEATTPVDELAFSQHDEEGRLAEARKKSEAKALALRKAAAKNQRKVAGTVTPPRNSSSTPPVGSRSTSFSEAGGESTPRASAAAVRSIPSSVPSAAITPSSAAAGTKPTSHGFTSSPSTTPPVLTLTEPSPKKKTKSKTVTDAIEDAFSATLPPSATAPVGGGAASSSGEAAKTPVDQFFAEAGFVEPIADIEPETAHERNVRKRKLKQKKQQQSVSRERQPATSSSRSPPKKTGRSPSSRSPATSHPTFHTPIDFNDLEGGTSREQSAPSHSLTPPASREQGGATCPHCGSMLGGGGGEGHRRGKLKKAAVAVAANSSLSGSESDHEEEDDETEYLDMNEVKEVLKVAATAGAAQQVISHRRAKENFRAIAANELIKKKIKLAATPQFSKGGGKNLTTFDPAVDAMLERAAKFKQNWEAKRKALIRQNAAISNFFYNRLQFALYGSSNRIKVKMPSLEQLLHYAEEISYDQQVRDSDVKRSKGGREKRRNQDDGREEEHSSSNSDAEEEFSKEAIMNEALAARGHAATISKNEAKSAHNKSPKNAEGETLARYGPLSGGVLSIPVGDNILKLPEWPANSNSSASTSGFNKQGGGANGGKEKESENTMSESAGNDKKVSLHIRSINSSLKHFPSSAPAHGQQQHQKPSTSYSTKRAFPPINLSPIPSPHQQQPQPTSGPGEKKRASVAGGSKRESVAGGEHQPQLHRKKSLIFNDVQREDGGGEGEEGGGLLQQEQAKYDYMLYKQQEELAAGGHTHLSQNQQVSIGRTSVHHQIRSLHMQRQRAQEEALLQMIEDQRKQKEEEELQKAREILLKKRVNVFASSRTPMPEEKSNKPRRKVKNTLSLKTRDTVNDCVSFVLEAEQFQREMRGEGGRASTSMM